MDMLEEVFILAEIVKKKYEIEKSNERFWKWYEDMFFNKLVCRHNLNVVNHNLRLVNDLWSIVNYDYDLFYKIYYHPLIFKQQVPTWVE